MKKELIPKPSTNREAVREVLDRCMQRLWSANIMAKRAHDLGEELSYVEESNKARDEAVNEILSLFPKVLSRERHDWKWKVPCEGYVFGKRTCVKCGKVLSIMSHVKVGKCLATVKEEGNGR